MRDLVERMLKTSGRRVDVSSPFGDAMLPSGHRLHVVLDGITRGFSAVNIRKFVFRAARLHDFVELGSMPPRAAAFLEASIRAGLNVWSQAEPRRVVSKGNAVSRGGDPRQ